VRSLILLARLQFCWSETTTNPIGNSALGLVMPSQPMPTDYFGNAETLLTPRACSQAFMGSNTPSAESTPLNGSPLANERQFESVSARHLVS
jgi:hypothetical protein